ncbi:membrane hypothetical protein [Azospirillaceae bacterium]
MKIAPVLVFTVSLLISGVSAIHDSWSSGQNNDRATQLEAKNKTPAPLVSNSTVFYSCVSGAAVGVLSLTFRPVIGWAASAGAIPGMIAVATVGGVGCAVGLMGGAALSTVSKIFS